MAGMGTGDGDGDAARLLARTDAVPSEAFEAMATGFPTDRRAHSAQEYGGWTEAYVPAYEDAVMGTTPLRDVAYGPLLAYMLRRFGPADRPSDFGKQLSGGWVLDSPDPDVFVLVRPSVSGARLSFVPYMASNLPSSWKQDDPRIHRIAAAYRATLVDLLRPVFVRDQAIDALGPADRSPFPGVQPHPASCAGIPPTMVSGGGWGDLLGLARHLGDGDIATGRDTAVGLLAGIVLGRATGLPREARVLASARMRGVGRAEMADRVPLDDADAAQAASLAGELEGLVRSASPHPLLDDPATVEASTGILRSVGVSDGLGERLAAIRHERNRADLANRILDAVGDGFDRSLLPDDVHDVDAFSGLLRGHGNEAAALMAEEALATPRGRGLLGMAMRLIDAHLARPGAPAP